MRRASLVGDSDLLDPIAEGSRIRMSRKARRSRPAFVATPSALVEAWDRAHAIEDATEPGDLVVCDDGAARAGLFALTQAMGPEDSRRRVVAVAGESLVLERLWVTGTLEADGEDDAFVMDWELALYRFAAGVVTPSRVAADLLRRFGIRDDVTVIDVARPSPGVPSRGPAALVWLPEPQSRRAQTAAMLRALSGSAREPSVVVTSDAELDGVWSGTVHEAHAHVFDLLAGRLEVSRDAPGAPSLIVLGDPFRVPDPGIAALRERGVPVAVPSGSTAAGLWPDAPTWSSEDDLAAIVDGETLRRPSSSPHSWHALEVSLPSPDPGRARRVSVGVPVFGDVSFLDECVESILGQTQPPFEVILIDDGSRSAVVDAALDRWARRHPGLIRVLRQPNRGVCVARNTLLEEMRGDAFILVDADDLLAPTFVEAAAAALRAAPDLVAVATWTEFFGDYAGIEAKPPFDGRVGRRENPIVSTCVLVDMSVRDMGVRFAPDLAFIYCEDWDFWAQIVAAGGRFGLVPEALARHRVHPGSGARRRTEFAHTVGRARAAERLRGR